MRKIKIVVIALPCIMMIFGCSRNLTPGISGRRNNMSYDTATFDFLYADAVKNKLLGNTAEALKILYKCIEINPSSDACYYQLGQISLQLGDEQRAKKYIQKAYSIDEKNIWYINFLASIYYQEEKKDSAIYYYERALKVYPEREEIKLNLAAFYTEAGKLNEANGLFEFFEEKYGVNERTTILYIKNLIAGKRFDEAEQKVRILLETNPDDIVYNGILAELYRSKGEADAAMEIYRRLLTLDAANPQTLQSYCDFLVAEKQYDNLLTILNLIAVNNFMNLEERITLLARLIEDEGLIKAKEEGFEKSLITFEENEKNKDILPLLRAEFYKKAEKSEKAIELLERVVEEKPENYFAWERLLLLYSENEQYEKLFLKGGEAASRFNVSYLIKLLYASAAIETGKYDIALEELRKAKILAGDQAELLVQVQSMEADTYYRKGEFDKAFGIFREALKSNPQDLIVLNNYAYFLAEQNRELKEAERMIKIVIDNEPDNGTFLDTYAWVLYKAGKNREAIKIMEEIMKKNPEPDADWYEHYAFMMKKAGNCDIAVLYWQKVLDLKPGKIELKKEIENCKRQ